MNNKLCCVLTPHITCEACKGMWCGPCWSDTPEGVYSDNWGPNKYASHVPLKDSSSYTERWVCDETIVLSDYRFTEERPIRFKLRR